HEPTGEMQSQRRQVSASWLVPSRFALNHKRGFSTSVPLRSSQVAGVDNYCCTGYSGGIFTAQKQNRFGHILRSKGDTHGYTTQPPCQGCIRVGLSIQMLP